MIPKEIFEKVRRIEIVTSRLVTDVFAGQYHSVFKGRGIEFDEVCEYQPGDDIRLIDWNVTARTGVPYVKKFVEEREMTVMLLIDSSLSCRFATTRELKSRLAAQIAAVLAFSAIRNNDKIGLIFFTGTVEKFIAPRKGKSHVLRLIREILCFEPKGRATNIATAIEFLSKVTNRRTVSFIISDFIQQGGADAYVKALSIANKRHDIVAISLDDPAEKELPSCALLEIEDPESGVLVTVDTTSKHLREAYKERAREREKERERIFKRINVDHINISTDAPFTDKLVQFFAMRKQRLR